jgi:hypothetical protein
MLDSTYFHALDRADFPALQPRLEPTSVHIAQQLVTHRLVAGKLPDMVWRLCECQHLPSLVALEQSIVEGFVLLLNDIDKIPVLLVGQEPRQMILGGTT